MYTCGVISCRRHVVSIRPDPLARPNGQHLISHGLVVLKTLNRRNTINCVRTNQQETNPLQLKGSQSTAQKIDGDVWLVHKTAYRSPTATINEIRCLMSVVGLTELFLSLAFYKNAHW